MEKLVSSWYSSVQSLPENYVFPLDTRPGQVSIPLCTNIPVIDLGKMAQSQQNNPNPLLSHSSDKTRRIIPLQKQKKMAALGHDHDQDYAIQQILHACQEFGFFQVINHGVCENLMDDTMGLFKEFFGTPNEDKESLYSEDQRKACRVHTSSYDYANEEIHFWRDNIQHLCHPLDEYIHLWPKNPTRYRDVVGKYSVEVRKLTLRILELISQGLGLEPEYFGDELTNVQLLSANHYPPCSDPSLALGLPKHSDPNLITVLLQGDVYGLQVYKDGQWHGVEPIPNAFVVNIGLQLQMISNGKLKSAEHRAVTNSRDPRTTIVSFMNPHCHSTIQPAKALIDKSNPQLYRAFISNEFLKTYLKKKGYTEAALEEYKVV